MPQQQIELKQLNPKDLRPAAYNPRKIGDAERAALLRGVAEFGMIDPIVARAEDLMVLGGHQRLSVAIELGLATIPVVLIEGLGDDRAAAVNVLLNNPRAQGGWDMKALSEVLSELDGNGFDATLTGFDEGELEGILAWTGIGVDPNAEWGGMPEFSQEPKAVRTIHIHFQHPDEVASFATAIGGNITEATRYIWWPIGADEN